MKINLTYKEANLLAAILWELATEGHHVEGGNGELAWRLTEKGKALAEAVFDKLEAANYEETCKTGKDRDLSGAPKNSIEEARWSK